MDIQEFLTCAKNKAIPSSPPDGATANGYSNALDNYVLHHSIRHTCTQLGMWTIVDEIWTQSLADWISGRKVLEIMAGGGWIAKALNQAGVKIIATDDYSWVGNQHKNMTPVFTVEKLDALEAVKSIDADILLVSWPPYGDETITIACDAWGCKKPIIYIGEGDGGCNAPEEFFDNFNEIDNSPSIPLMCWDGLHDHIYIGYWNVDDQ